MKNETVKPTQTSASELGSFKTNTQILRQRVDQQKCDIKNDPTKLDKLYRSVGVIRSNWYNKKNELVTFSYGTAFQITSQIIITCTHNLFSRFRKAWAREVEFVPNIANEEIIHSLHRMRKSMRAEGKKESKTYKAKCIYSLFDIENNPSFVEEVNFENNPQNFELSLVVLEEEVKGQIPEKKVQTSLQHFPKYENNRHEISAIIDNRLQKTAQNENNDSSKKSASDLSKSQNYLPLGVYTSGKPLTIVGYPSLNYKTVMNIQMVHAKRYLQVGQPYSLPQPNNQQNILHYKIKTSIGMSGSPILVREGSEFVAVGIHTHRGRQPDYNSGIYFDSKMISKIKELEMKIEQDHKIPPQIVYISPLLQQIAEENEQENSAENEQKKSSSKSINEENAPSPSSGSQEKSIDNSSPFQSPIPQNLSQKSYQNKSQMYDSPQQSPIPQDLPQEQQQCNSQMSNPLSDSSSEMSQFQLDEIDKFFTITKEPLSECEYFQAKDHKNILRPHSSDLSKLSYQRVQSIQINNNAKPSLEEGEGRCIVIGQQPTKHAKVFSSQENDAYLIL